MSSCSTRCPALDAIRWQRARERIVKLLGWKQVVALDKERAPSVSPRGAATDEMDGGEVYPVVVPWEEPVTDLGAVLDELVEELGRYMSASLLFLNTTALWSVLAHLLQRDDLGINISPRLAIQSPDKRCGKTTLLEAISCVVPKPDMLTSLTPAALFRTAGRVPPHVPDRRGRYPDAQGCSR